MSEDCEDLRLLFCDGPQFSRHEDEDGTRYEYQFPYAKRLIGLYGVTSVPDYGYVIVTVPKFTESCFSCVYDAQGNEIARNNW
jgi:hypothetical protein